MGGNIFKDTSDIKKEEVLTILTEFKTELKKYNIDIDWSIVGSAGKKDISGDIDLAISSKDILNLKNSLSIDKKEFKDLFDKFKKRSRTATDEMLEIRTILTFLSKELKDSDKIEVCTKKITTTNMFFSFYSETFNKRVQIDWIIGDIKWLEFANFSKVYEDKTLKGLHRTQLILSILQYYGYSFSHHYGIKDKETGKIVANSPEEVIKLFKNKYTWFEIMSKEVLSDYWLLYNLIADNNEIKDIYLKILDRTRCDIPTNLQDYWIENKERLGLTGKFLVETSKLLRVS